MKYEKNGTVGYSTMNYVTAIMKGKFVVCLNASLLVGSLAYGTLQYEYYVCYYSLHFYTFEFANNSMRRPAHAGRKGCLDY